MLLRMTQEMGVHCSVLWPGLWLWVCLHISHSMSHLEDRDHLESGDRDTPGFNVCFLIQAVSSLCGYLTNIMLNLKSSFSVTLSTFQGLNHHEYVGAAMLDSTKHFLHHRNGNGSWTRGHLGLSSSETRVQAVFASKLCHCVRSSQHSMS